MYYSTRCAHGPHHVAKEWVDRCKKPSSTTAGSSCASAPSSAKRSSGSFNEMTFLNGVVLEPEPQLKLIDEYGGIEALGGEHTAPHFAAAWAMPATLRSSGANGSPAAWAVRATPGRRLAEAGQS